MKHTQDSVEERTTDLSTCGPFKVLSYLQADALRQLAYLSK